MKRPGLQYESPTKFSPKQRIALALIPPAAANLMRLIFLTGRRKPPQLSHIDEAIARHGRVILAIWHETLGIGLWFFRGTGYHTLTSYSFDGELAARISGNFGLPALRGSSSRGGFKALAEMQRALEMGIPIGFTVDGPRGPRRVAKPGIAILSARSGLPVVPIGIAARPCWRMRSWDRFAVPKPFATATALAGPPVPAEGHASLDDHRKAIEDALNAVQSQVERDLGLTREALGLPDLSDEG